MNQMTDIEMVDFVTSAEENCAGKNRKEEDPKQSGLRLRKHHQEQEGDGNKKEEYYDDNSVVGTGNGPAESNNFTFGSSEDNTLEGDEEEDNVKPEKKKRIRPKKKCPYCGVMNSSISRHCKLVHEKKNNGEGDFACKLCKKRLTSWNGLVRHLRGKVHADQAKAKEMAGSMDRRRKNVPIVEMQRVRSRPNEAMGSGMGFERREINGLGKRRRLQSGNEMYGSVENIIIDLTGSSDSDSEENSGTTVAISLVPTNVKRPDVTPSMEACIRELQEEKRCKICLDQPAEVLFIPCRHLCSCTGCEKYLRKCPICRAEIEKSMRTYRS
ncbi:uncharacterized protein LOC143464937 isoform X2 [Clavelina lepadiformis]|uniref:uncharacterized protein LOC143464830 isoform X2 n=1 Tax=Clavelina lepadiformis TaxID=159417 RepID=UPI0040432C02